MHYYLTGRKNILFWLVLQYTFRKLTLTTNENN